jgi:hypothetical protein
LKKSGLQRPENLSWTNLVFYRNVHKTKVVAHSQQWGCMLNSCFVYTTPWLIRAFFILQPLIEAAKPLQVKRCILKQTS